ncbi:hypothetical protein EYV94_18100 [Puteibacter caeruleilacunae]|nr:hypothetical protein EYV94_18100 [Puteibacter caeruleilacunae]
MRLIIIAICFFCLHTACNIEGRKPVEATNRSMALTDSASNLLVNYHLEKQNTAKLDVILELLNKAIDCDSTNFLAYNNKLMVLSLKNEYLKAINLLDKMLSFNKNHAQLLFFKGLIYEKLEDPTSTQIFYNKADIMYEKQLKLYPDSMQLIADRLFFTAFTKGKEEAHKELNLFILRHPDKKIQIHRG